MAEEEQDIRTNKRKQKAAAMKLIEIDMNPMVDLAFLLLTFFMLTTTFNRPQAMEIVMPAKDKEREVSHQPIKESRALTLVLGEKTELYYYRGLPESGINPIELAELPELLTGVQMQVPDLIVLIKAHPESHFRSLVDVLDELNVQDVKRYAIASYEEQEENLLEGLR